MIAYKKENPVDIWAEPDVCIGGRAERKIGVLEVCRPVDRGIVTDWDMMEKFWHHAFYNEIRVSPSQYPVILTEIPLNPKANRERMAKLMFETFEVPKLFFERLALLATYRSSGCVLDSGHGTTHIVPIFECIPITHAIVKLDGLAGQDIHEYFRILCGRRGFALKALQSGNYCENGIITDTIDESIMVRDIMNSLGYVAMDYEEEMKKEVEYKEYTDKFFSSMCVPVGRERFICPEALFQPSVVNMNNLKETEGIAHSISRAITTCNDHQDLFFGNIVLVGGNTLWAGHFQERLEKELSELTSSKVEIIAPPDRQYLAWKGGSRLSTFEDFDHSNYFFSKQDYEEKGLSGAFQVRLGM